MGGFMKLLILLATTILFSTTSLADQNLKDEICTVFAEENSGLGIEWSEEEDAEIEVVYDYDLAYDHCFDNIEPEEAITTADDGSVYYEFDLFVCGNSYQYETLGYAPGSNFIDSLAGSGEGDECPYKLEE